MRSQIQFDVPGGLSITEIKQIFQGMNEDPQMRPRARRMRYWNLSRTTLGPNDQPRERLDPGPPLGRGPATAFTPGAQALLITYATNAPEAVGTLLPLDEPQLTLGRRGDQDLVIPESTVSSAHAHLRWQQGSWIVEDQQSANGSYADHGYERATPIVMVHGSDAQFGECRLKLVSFGAGSPLHQRALRYLARRDGLSGLLTREHLMKALDEDGQFSDWYEAPMHVCRYELRAGKQPVSLRPTIGDLLALRQAARRAVEITEMRLPSLAPVVAGRTGPLEFVISLVGPPLEEARHVVEQVASQMTDLLPEPLELAVTLVAGKAGRSARHLID
jgi:serine/threonine-protein kinase